MEMAPRPQEQVAPEVGRRMRGRAEREEGAQQAPATQGTTPVEATLPEEDLQEEEQAGKRPASLGYALGFGVLVALIGFMRDRWRDGRRASNPG